MIGTKRISLGRGMYITMFRQHKDSKGEFCMGTDTAAFALGEHGPAAKAVV